MKKSPREVDYNEGTGMTYLQNPLTPHAQRAKFKLVQTRIRSKLPPRAKSPQKKDYADSDHFASDPDDAAKVRNGAIT